MQAGNAIKFLIIGAAAIAAIFYSSTFVVDQAQYAVKIRLGDPITTYTEPGLYFKLPFVTKIFHIDNRLLSYDADPRSIITKDKKEMEVDNYAKWRVVDPLQFYKAMRGGSISEAQARLNDIIYSQVRRVLGNHTLSEIVSGNTEFVRNAASGVISNVEAISVRREIIDEITLNSKENATDLGIEVVDVRIKRADLPKANSEAVYGRMIAERRRDAKRYRSEGEEQKLGIMSEADRDRIKIIAEVQKQAEEIRGDADAKALTVYADAYGRDPEFFMFQRSHEAYREVLQEGTTLLFSSERDFFRELK